MNQLPMPLPERAFDGKTYSVERDFERLNGQLGRVHKQLAQGEWLSLCALAACCGGSEASVSARIRDLRKPKYGGHTIERRYDGHGLWRYRMQTK